MGYASALSRSASSIARRLVEPGIRRRVGQRGHLRAGRLGELAPAMADIHVPQSGQPVDVLAAVGVLDDRAVAFDPNPGMRVRRRVMQRVQQVLEITRNRVGNRGSRRRHDGCIVD